ncbi:DNA (cytosine-5)-methyltransferase 1-like [Cimex lectularius]|uniref:DNA (cytosine-5)-methyltransferase n=1 Tax=Cimex lectularius TaxID=79782 RepID=A0A8I6RYX8_CIMLE|nr:DNA (cytosine-5)-methyltransferase 1-like [Cimex lectularius]
MSSESKEVPSDVLAEVEKLDREYEEGFFTKKGFYYKKWLLLKPYAGSELVHDVESNNERLDKKEIQQDEYFSSMSEILSNVIKFKSSGADSLEGEEIIERTPSPCREDFYSSPIPGPSTATTPRSYKRSTSPRTSIVKTRRSTRRSSGPSSDQNTITEMFLNSPKNQKPHGSGEIGKTEESVNKKKEGAKIKTPKRNSLKWNSLVMKDEDKENINENGELTEKVCNGTFKSDLEDGNVKYENLDDIIGVPKNNGAMELNESDKTTQPNKKNSNGIDDELPVKMDENSVMKHDIFYDNGFDKRKSDGDMNDDDCEDDLSSKKIKLENEPKKEREKIKTSLNLTIAKMKSVTKRCDICCQLLESDIKLYEGHPNNAVEEFVALTDPKLSLFTGDEEVVDDYDSRPQNKITHFSIYDKAGHLCPFDNGLVERNVLLYFSGYLKPVYEEDGRIEGGIPTKDLGPINEWWISGFDGGEKALVGFSTDYGDYFLMEPSPQYAPMMEGVKEKTYLGKIVIEFLLDEENPSFEDLLNKLQTTVPPPGVPKLTEDSLLRHAQFICDQVLSFEAASETNDNTSLITTQCMRSLVHLAGVTFRKRQIMRKSEKKQFNVKKPVWSKATTTPLVNNVFETFFSEQLDNTDGEVKGPKRMRCGICEACQMADCGTCVHCRDMVKFGGSGRSKQACIKRRCPNMAVQEADDSEPEDEYSYQEAAEKILKGEVKVRSARTTGGKKQVEWTGIIVADDGRRVFYKTAIVGGEEISVGDCVSVEPVNPTTPLVIGKVLYMWENKFSQKFMHAHWFLRGCETVLGETADPQELFLVDECENSLLNGIYSKVTVLKKTPGDNWSREGGDSLSAQSLFIDPKNDKMFFYQKRYNENVGRFEDPYEDPVCSNQSIAHRFCPSCERLYQQQKFENPSVQGKIEESSDSKLGHYELVKWRGDEYTVGCCVYLSPSVFKFKTYGNVYKPLSRKGEKDVNEDLYPEFYRKSSDHIKGSNITTPSPFCIGLIVDIFTNSKDKIVAPADICIRVIKFYRPENTSGITSQLTHIDLNKLYASDEEVIVNFGDVTGKCAVVYSENLIEDIYTWSKEGPNRFYFNEAYDSQTQTLVEPSRTVKMLGNAGKGKGKGKAKVERKKIEIAVWPTIKRPLRCLDVFAGCGGLSEGLHQSGVAETKWAIEKEEAAANAFRLNNLSATVFSDDCNHLLKLVMNGELKTDKGQKLPQKGEVELLCGGPPCQGFSGMNRFNSRQYSIFKNSLIVSYLSYCDYYRPRFFILENVRNFVSFKRNMVLKLTLRCLIRMGYQVAFGILQAGNYGVPQTRRRAIILAAAPGEVLPNFPEPLHVFNPRATQLTIMVDDKKLVSNCQWVESAPFRTITVRDAMSDLPQIPNGFRDEEIPYIGEPISHFQKQMRGSQYQTILRDHICKDMAPIVEARISQIPTASGSDWRDLPNISVRLNDGTHTKKLIYTHHDKKNGKSKTGALRGVCACATGKPCDPMDRQFNTLIPWCLPHTGNRHNHWAGLYGRLEWDGFFSTTVTNPEPMGKQGRVLHPEQTRVVSVRECARSQGFPDKYRFYGTILDKHRQVGNAVPPPLGAALGREIRKCVSQKEKTIQLKEETISKMEIDD